MSMNPRTVINAGRVAAAISVAMATVWLIYLLKLLVKSAPL